MIQVGRRVIFDITTGKVICDMGEMQGDVLARESIGSLDYIDLPYGHMADEFSRSVKWHIDPETKEVVFDELREPTLTPEQQIEQLENELLIAKGLI